MTLKNSYKVLILIWLSFIACNIFSGAGASDAGGDHGDVDLQWAGLRRGEGRGGNHVHIHASGNGAISFICRHLDASEKLLWAEHRAGCAGLDLHSAVDYQPTMELGSLNPSKDI